MPSERLFSIAGALRREVLDFTGGLASLIPGRSGHYIRRLYWNRRFKQLGDNALFGVGLTVYEPSNISIGSDFVSLQNCVLGAVSGGKLVIGNAVSLNSNVCLDASEGGFIKVGNGSGIAHNCVMRSSAHAYENPLVPFKYQGHVPGTITVDEDVWVAANVTLLPGTHLRRGCIVSSGSVVGGQFAEFSVIAGNPARVIGKRGRDHEGGH